MDSMEDSGFDSDQKTQLAGLTAETVPTESPASPNGTTTSTKAITALKKSAKLQKKIERQRESAQKTAVSDLSNRKGILSRNRLPVPTKSDAVMSATDMQPLVMIDSEESEEEFSMPALSQEAHLEITQQLIKDGYNLDLEPDDEDLDLIPPRPFNERWVCCPGSTFPRDSCVVQ